MFWGGFGGREVSKKLNGGGTTHSGQVSRQTEPWRPKSDQMQTYYLCTHDSNRAKREGSPLCHHEGRHKRWEFLNWCTFRFRSTPSSFFPTQQIGFGADDLFNSFLNFLTNIFFFVFFWGTPNIIKKKKQSAGCQGLVGPWPYGPNDNPKGPTTTL